MHVPKIFYLHLNILSVMEVCKRIINVSASLNISHKYYCSVRECLGVTSVLSPSSSIHRFANRMHINPVVIKQTCKGGQINSWWICSK